MKFKPIGKRCRKVAYKTKEKAIKALKELRHRRTKNFYICPYCKGRVYHLTSEG